MTSLEWSFASEAEATRSKTYCRDKLGLHGEIQHFPQQAIQRSTIQFWMGQTTKITNSDLYVTSRNRTRSRRITGDPRVMEHPQLNAFYHIMPAFEEAATMADQSCLDPADRDDVYRSAIGACLSLQQQLTAISLPMPTSIPTPSRAFMVLAWIPCLLQSQRDICPTSPEFPRLFWSLRAILDVLPAFPSHPVTTAADVRPLNTLFQKATRLLAQRAFYVEWCLRYQEDTPFSLFPDNQDHRPGSDFIQSFLVDYAKNLIAAMNELLKSWDPPFRRTFLWELFLHSYLLLTLRFLPCAKSLLFEALCQELPKTSEFRAWQTDQTKPRISRQQHTHFKFWRQLPTHLGSIHTTNCSELEFRKILDELDEIFPGTLFTPLFRDELQSINFDTAPDSIITKSILNSHMIWNRQCWMDSSFFSDFISNCNEVCNTIRIDLLVFRENNRNFPRGSGRLTSSPRRRQGGQYSVSPLPSPRFSFSVRHVFLW